LNATIKDGDHARQISNQTDVFGAAPRRGNALPDRGVLLATQTNGTRVWRVPLR
jgi:hypothetical protein